MKLIALMLGLALEHFATQWLSLRELRWFDGYFDYGLRQSARRGRVINYAVFVCLLLIPVVPVLWLSMTLAGTDLLWDLPYLLFAVLVLFFCLGPRDLANEVHEYCEALDSGDAAAARRVLTELSEADQRRGDEIEAVEEAVFVQATNRIFGVVFWFMVLGPVGAWLFRLGDLLRRRAVFESARDPERGAGGLMAVETIHGALAWIPARLAAVGYALSGSFDDALNGWRDYQLQPGEPFYRSNDQLVARVGKAAMTGFLEQPANSSAAARNSMRLVSRTLFIWMTVIAVTTLAGWSI